MNLRSIWLGTFIVSSDRHVRRTWRVAAVCLLFLFPPMVWAQAASSTSVVPPAQPEAPKDTLGRNTPRGTVLGFLSSVRKGNPEIAALYLNTPLRGGDAAVLAHELGTVLDRRLPARINQISDEPEGSVPDPLRPDEDVVGTIDTENGSLDIVVERVDRGKAGKVWLFSGKTLSSIPTVFQDVSTPALEEFLPEFLVRTRVASVPLFEWLALFVGLPMLYGFTGLLNRALLFGVRILQRRLGHTAPLSNVQILPIPIRLFLVAMAIRFLLAIVTLPLLARQFWSTVVLFIVLVGCIWCLLALNRRAEHYLINSRRRQLRGSASVLRLFRRLIDGLLLFAGLLFILYHFDINVTAALAGLGVGGIAVALAAQKTLENVIGGVSLIADDALRVGDFLNLGDVQGTVEDVGLRSTRIRTLDRTLVSLPNGQIATMRLETVSARDKFWFHPVIGLRYETTPIQLRSILVRIRDLLRNHPNVYPASLRVRFIRFGPSSLDVDIFAYAAADDWGNFLEIQEELLFGIIDIIHKAGTGIAFPSQTLYLDLERSESLKQILRHRGKTKDGELVA